MKAASATPHAADPTPAAVWRAYQGVSAQAIDENSLIERHLPLVRSVVDRIKINLPSHVEAADLYSVGITGLIAAVRRYDPEQGKTFAAYAAMRIRGAILDELRRMDWCPRRARARTRKLKTAIGVIEQRVGRTATAAEICAELNLTEKEYAKWLDEARPLTFIPLDQLAENEDGPGASMHEILPDESDVTGRETLEKAEQLQLLAQRMAELPDMQRKILVMYYFENLRLAEIALAFDLTESRICQIHTQTILGLRAWIERVRNR
jgi:RNA polymerase sigma factor for flagellar operon FliA